MNGLVGNALLALTEIKARCPGAVLLSGKRTRTEQARAMAENCVAAGSEKWIADTYKWSRVSSACIDSAGVSFRHLKKPSIDAVTLAIAAAMALFSDEQLAALSSHMTGRAFDLKPGDSFVTSVTREVVKKFGGELITNEGGLNRLHAEFKQ